MNDPIKITILSCIWRRPEITRVFVEGLHRLQENAPDWVDLSFVLVYSNNDDLLTLQSCTDDSLRNCNLVFAPNRPLGRKHNLGLSYCHNCCRYDYIMQLGSDDLLSDDIWLWYKPLFESGNRFFGLNELYFYNSVSHQVKHYESTQVFGAGRCIHRSVIAQFVRSTEYVQLWTDSYDSCLDGCSEDNITKEIGFSNLRVTPVRADKPLVIDIKSGVNIHDFDSIPADVMMDSGDGWFEDLLFEFGMYEWYITQAYRGYDSLYRDRKRAAGRAGKII